MSVVAYIEHAYSLLHVLNESNL